MAQEFTIKSPDIEDKINQLLPSQGGFQPGVDFSASTMVVPIVDLTETAEGSGLRQDLQTASSFSSTNVECVGADNLVVNTTGYYKCVVSYTINTGTVANNFVRLYVDDGTTEKQVFRMRAFTSGTNSSSSGTFQLIVFLSAGKELRAQSNNTSSSICVSTHQIADINGNLVNPI